MTSTLQEWINANNPGDEMYWKWPWWDQVAFMRDILPRVFARSYEEYKDLPKVIGTHRSKSIECPVYFFDLPHAGLKVWARYNFYDWNVSVESTDRSFKVDDFLGVIGPTGDYGYCFCQGMEDKKFPPINEDGKRFTVCINDKYALYLFAVGLAGETCRRSANALDNG